MLIVVLGVWLYDLSVRGLQVLAARGLDVEDGLRGRVGAEGGRVAVCVGGVIVLAQLARGRGVGVVVGVHCGKWGVELLRVCKKKIQAALRASRDGRVMGQR